MQSRVLAVDRRYIGIAFRFDQTQWIHECDIITIGEGAT